jgi:protease I
MAKVAVLVGQEFEDSELRIPVDRLREAGHKVEIVGQKRGETLRGKKGKEETQVDRAVSSESGASAVSPKDYDALVIPGGRSPANLRKDPNVIEFVREFMSSGKPVAAVCHGPQLLVEAGVANGRMMTSWPEIRPELERAGVRWVDREVVEEGALITSRKPEDLEAFSQKLIERIGIEPDRREKASGERRSASAQQGRDSAS